MTTPKAAGVRFAGGLDPTVMRRVQHPSAMGRAYDLLQVVMQPYLADGEVYRHRGVVHIGTRIAPDAPIDLDYECRHVRWVVRKGMVEGVPWLRGIHVGPEPKPGKGWAIAERIAGEQATEDLWKRDQTSPAPTGKGKSW